MVFILEQLRMFGMEALVMVCAAAAGTVGSGWQNRIHRHNLV